MRLIEKGKNIYSGVFINNGLHHKLALERYRKRRERFLKEFSFPLLIFSVDTGPGGHNIWPYIAAPIYQEPLFMYLTGINQLPCALFLDPLRKNKKEVLFLPPKDIKFEFWQGVRLGLGESVHRETAKFVTGIENILPLKDLDKILHQRFKNKKSSLGLLWYEGKKQKDGKKKKIIIKDSNWTQGENIKKKIRSSKDCHELRFENISAKQFSLRLPLDSVDKKNALKAGNLTAEAFQETLPHIKSCCFEYEIAGILDGNLLKRTPYGKSFPTIAASGKNATILHYEKYDDKLGKGELFLLDFGLRWGTMHADISRTIPLSGQFNPLQKILYTICLETGHWVEKNARAGVSIKELNDLCWNRLENELETHFLSKGGKMIRSYDKIPHGVSHLMGEMEHDGDPFGEYKNSPMEEGWMISSEPGLYGRFSITLEGKKYDEHIGIRIEDNLLIQKNNCLNLSKQVPKTVLEIEELMRVGH